jgi:hypothetical protein
MSPLPNVCRQRTSWVWRNLLSQPVPCGSTGEECVHARSLLHVCLQLLPSAQSMYPTLCSAGGCSRQVMALSTSARKHGLVDRWQSRRPMQACTCHAWGPAQPGSGLKAGTLTALQQHRRQMQRPKQATRCGPCLSSSSSSARLSSCSRRFQYRQRPQRGLLGLWTCVRSGGWQQGRWPAGMLALRSRSLQWSAASRPANQPLLVYSSTACSIGHWWSHTWTPTAGSLSSQPQVDCTPGISPGMCTECNGCLCTNRYEASSAMVRPMCRPRLFDPSE